jgi:hypothetical protein
MSNISQIIVSKIHDYASSQGYERAHWYVGIASDPEQRLFSDHNVDRDNGRWIYVEAVNNDHAREAERVLLNAGYDGGTGGGDGTTKHVYAFLKTASTIR